MGLLSLSAVFTGKNRVWSTFLANGLCEPMSIRDSRGVWVWAVFIE